MRGPPRARLCLSVCGTRHCTLGLPLPSGLRVCACVCVRVRACACERAIVKICRVCVRRFDSLLHPLGTSVHTDVRLSGSR